MSGVKIKNIVYTGLRITALRLFNKRAPLFVSWAITNKCNLTCLYCGNSSKSPTELNIHEAFSIIDQLKKAGTLFISFTGGEPLMRDDIDVIINYLRKKNIKVNLNTNGTLFVDRFKKIEKINSTVFSLDGSEDVNDYIRGKGTFKKVTEAIKLCKEKGIEASIITVLSKYNLDCVDYLVGLADDLDVVIGFQPVTLTLLGTDIYSTHIPDKQAYKKSIDKLIQHKKKHRILNTIRGLSYLRDWPDTKYIICQSNRFSCRIEPNGQLFHCGRKLDNPTSLSCVRNGVWRAFDNLAFINCRDCWCALRLELNYIASFDLKAIFSSLKTQLNRGKLR